MIRAAALVLVVAALGSIGPAHGDPTVAIPPPAEPAQSVPPPDRNASTAAPGLPDRAAPAPGADQGGRFTFHRSGDAFVRLDTRTGDVAQCGWNAGAWACTLVPDERAALESEIARLQRENAALKQTLLARGIDLPSNVTAQAKTPRANAPIPPADVPDAAPRPPKAPSEIDFDSAIAYVKHVWRKFVDMMLDLQRDVQRRG